MNQSNIIIALSSSLYDHVHCTTTAVHIIKPLKTAGVKVHTKTVYDVLDKPEGKYEPGSTLWLH